MVIDAMRKTVSRVTGAPSSRGSPAPCQAITPDASNAAITIAGGRTPAYCALAVARLAAALALTLAAA
ncbi:hypothetical protein GCM10009659_20300 [Leucobacter albus]